ncbi:secreted protein, partial [Candidatus Thiomargarita nelsonii]
MKKRVLLQTAVLLAATVNLSEVAASCFPPAKGQTPLDVLKCLQSELDSQQKRIAELEKAMPSPSSPQWHDLYTPSGWSKYGDVKCRLRKDGWIE